MLQFGSRLDCPAAVTAQRLSTQALLPQDKSHQGLQSDFGKKVSENRMFGFLFALGEVCVTLPLDR
jgi:hypothetical protein